MSETESRVDPTEFRDDERLRKAERLLERGDFLTTRHDGRRRSSDNFVVYARETERPQARLGITASTDVGRANVRNWWKRRIREIFRRHKLEYPQGHDYVVIVRPSSTKAPVRDIRDELLVLFRRSAGSEDD